MPGSSTPKRNKTDTDETFGRRANRTINTVMTRHRILKWSDYYFKETYFWAGKLATIGKTDPDRLAFKTLQHRDLQSTFDYAKRNQGNQGHGKCFHAWRWETDIFNFWHQRGHWWREVATDAREWSAYWEQFVGWRQGSALSRSIGRKRKRNAI